MDSKSSVIVASVGVAAKTFAPEELKSRTRVLNRATAPSAGPR